jgi:hypothetical protein
MEEAYKPIYTPEELVVKISRMAIKYYEHIDLLEYANTYAQSNGLDPSKYGVSDGQIYDMDQLIIDSFGRAPIHLTDSVWSDNSCPYPETKEVWKQYPAPLLKAPTDYSSTNVGYETLKYSAITSQPQIEDAEWSIPFDALQKVSGYAWKLLLSGRITRILTTILSIYEGL